MTTSHVIHDSYIYRSRVYSSEKNASFAVEGIVTENSDVCNKNGVILDLLLLTTNCTSKEIGSDITSPSN